MRAEWNRQKEADQAAAYNLALSESSLTLEASRLLLLGVSFYTFQRIAGDLFSVALDEMEKYLMKQNEKNCR